MSLDYQTTDAARSLDEQQLLDWLQGWHVVDPAGGSNEVTVGSGDYEFDVAGGDVNLGGTITNAGSGSVVFGADVDPNEAKQAVIYRDVNGGVQKEVGDKGTRDPEWLNVRQTAAPPTPSMFDVDGTVLAEVLIPGGANELTGDHLRDRRLPADLNAATIEALTTLTAPTKSSPSQTGEGEFVWDTDDDKLTVGDGSARKTLVNEERTLSGGNGIESIGNLSQNRTIAISTDGVGEDELLLSISPSWTDEHDYSGGGIILPSAAAPTPTAEGDIIWDTDDDKVRIGDGSATVVLVKESRDLTGGTGIDAIGDLSADRTIAISTGGVSLTELANPFGLDELTDMDLDATDLTDGATVLYESSNGWFRNEIIQALRNLTGNEVFQEHPFASADIKTDAITASEILLSITPTWTGEHTFSGGITGLPAPTNDGDAARKAYVDAVEQALDIKDSVVAATDGSDVDLTSASDPNPIDGVTLSDGDRILLKDQNTGSENGIYDAVTATDPTTWTRSADADEDDEVTAGLFTFVEEGTNNSDKGFVLTTNDPITVGSTDLSFTQFSGAGQITAGDALGKSGDTLNVKFGVGTELGSDAVDLDETVIKAGNAKEVGVHELGQPGDDTKTEWGAAPDFAARYDSTDDEWVVSDEVNNDDVMGVDKDGNLAIQGTLTESTTV